MAADTIWYDEVRRITEALVAMPSVSPDADGENRVAEAISNFLRHDTELTPEAWPTGDGRHSVACLLTGGHVANTGNTVILMGHFDTVGVAEFRSLDANAEGQIAFNHEALKQALLERGQFPEDKPDEWMVGRGALDMKSGLAAQIAIMRRLWRERDSLAGNVLMLACPDEETESLGILSALPRLIELRDKHALHYLGIINADYTAPRADDDEHVRYIYSGTVGKLLPAFYILGDPTHVGEPFRGVDAAHLAAEVVRRLTLNAHMGDHWRGDGAHSQKWAVPPVALHMRDLKPEYNVQTAGEAFVYANWLTLTRSPREALHAMMTVAREAFGAAMRWRDEQYAQFKGAQPAPRTYESGRAFAFADLCEIVMSVNGWDITALADWLDNIADRTSPAPPRAESRELSLQLVQEVAAVAQIAAPAIIVFFAPPYYPHVPPASNKLSNALDNVLSARPPAPTIERRGFYPYISDMSYVNLNDGVSAQLDALRANMPLLGRGYDLDFEAMAALQCPVINIGPWGKDAHGLLERVHMPYSFETLPQLIYDTISAAL